MPFDFKKEQKELYLPGSKPQILEVPPMNYLAVRGQGDPNDPGGAYQKAIGLLYNVAYTLKMSYKTAYRIEGFFEYVVPPLEGFWQQDAPGEIDYGRKDAFRWISVIRLPDFVSPNDVDWAKATASQKKKADCSAVEFFSASEGLCAQILHIGPYDDEPATVAQLNRFLEEQGYETDLTEARLHHEIYLSDVRRVAPEAWKTVIRHPIKKRG
ncbi:MAG: GyrI-like domain-containing protein [Clostridia bacterium]|nr:GyrI-like domain-containing protein [Clostridia bacterium]